MSVQQQLFVAQAEPRFGIGCRPEWHNGAWLFRMHCDARCRHYDEIVVQAIPRVLMWDSAEPLEKALRPMPVCRFATRDGSSSCTCRRERLRVIDIMLDKMGRELERLGGPLQESRRSPGCCVTFVKPDDSIMWRCDWSSCSSLVGDPSVDMDLPIGTTRSGVQTHTWQCVRRASVYSCGDEQEQRSALMAAIAAAHQAKESIMEEADEYC